MSTTTTLLESQLRRIDHLWTRYEDTGDEQWLIAATEADRIFLHMKAAFR